MITLWFSMANEELDRSLAREQLLATLRAWTYVMGADELDAGGLARSLGWLRGCWQAGDNHLPFFLVHDLGYLLLLGSHLRFTSMGQLDDWPAKERRARLAYEDRVLGRFAVSAAVMEAHVAIAGMAEAERGPALVHALRLALAPSLSSVDALPATNPALLRHDPAERLAPAAFAGWSELLDDTWRRWAIGQLEAVTDVLAHAPLYSSDDLWEISHHPRIPSESARLALRHVQGAASAIGPVAPRTALALKRRPEELPSDRAGADTYPTGGFDAISRQGSPENLVRTEIAYVGEGATGNIDLFDVRYVQHELLFYTRDESPLLDELRHTVVIFDGPSRLRYKSPELPAQALVMIEALAIVLFRDHQQIYGASGARLQLVWRCHDDEDVAVADEESTLLGTFFEDEIAHHRVFLELCEAWPPFERGVAMVFSTSTATADVSPTTWIRLDGAAWYKDGEPLEVHSHQALRTFADDLLALS